MNQPGPQPASRPAEDAAASGPPAVSASTLRALLDRCDEGMCLVEPAEWDVVYANAALSGWIAQPDDPSRKRNLVDWLPHVEEAGVLDRLNRVARGESDEASFSGHVVTPDGDETAVEFTASRVDAGDQPLMAIAMRRPLLSAATLRESAQIDPLTGLADRAFLMDRLTSLVEVERSGDHQCAVLFVDVDGFKQVNDAYGHLVGDRVLCEVARRLAGCVRSDDHVVRFGGDEFVVLLEHVRGQGEIQPVVDRISAAFDRPVGLPQGSVTLAVSVGVAEAEPHGQTAAELLDAADRAMYASKRSAT